ncbi:hypothetical protein HDU97_005799 [Phlyctochytrium planicorne]|nr:hypothetical protein HDU97_005799 [Phlyctochytrium planicorne]
MTIAWLVQFRPELFWRECAAVVGALSAKGRLDAIKIVASNDKVRKYAFDCCELHSAIESTSETTEVVRFLLESKLSKPSEVNMALAIQQGKLEMVKLLYAHGGWKFDCDGFLATALDMGNMDVLSFLEAKYPDQDIHDQHTLSRTTNSTRNILCQAIEEGSLNCVRFIKHFIPDLDSDLLATHATEKSFEVFKYLFGKLQMDVTSELVVSAAQTGNIDILNFVLANLCEYRDYNIVQARTDLRCAISTLPVHVVVYLHKHFANSCIFNDEECFGPYLCSSELAQHVALSGDVEALKYLHEKCKFAGHVVSIDVAAELGHLEMVKYLHSRTGAECSNLAMTVAAGNGRLDIENHDLVKYLFGNIKREWTPNVMHMLKDVKENFNFAAVKYVIEALKIEVDQGGLEAVIRWGDADFVKFVLDRTSPKVSSSELLSTYFKHPGMDEEVFFVIVDYIGDGDDFTDNGGDDKQLDRQLLLSNAVWNGNLDVLKYCHWRWPVASVPFSVPVEGEICAEFAAVHGLWKDVGRFEMEPLVEREYYDTIRVLVVNGAVDMSVFDGLNVSETLVPYIFDK